MIKTQLADQARVRFVGQSSLGGLSGREAKLQGALCLTRQNYRGQAPPRTGYGRDSPLSIKNLPGGNLNRCLAPYGHDSTAGIVKTSTPGVSRQHSPSWLWHSCSSIYQSTSLLRQFFEQASRTAFVYPCRALVNSTRIGVASAPLSTTSQSPIQVTARNQQQWLAYRSRWTR